MYSTTKRILVGKPIASAEEHHQRLRKIIALPVFASDAISSTAYATDEILVVLLIQAGIGAEAWKYLVPIAVIVCVLLTIVVAQLPPDDLRLPERRRQLHRQPREPGRDPRRSSPARRCSSTTSLTVAVSVAGGVLAIRSAAGFDQQVDRPALPGLRRWS